MGKTLGEHNVTRAAFALVIVSFLLSTAVSLVSLHFMNQQTEREMNRMLATQVYDYMNAELSQPIMAARTMSSNSFLADTLRAEGQLGEDEFTDAIVSYLASVEDGLGYDHAFVISDSSKRYYTRSGMTRTIHPQDDKSDSWYGEFTDSTNRYELDVDNDETNPHDLTVYVNAKVNDSDGRLLGICGVGVRVTGIQELFRTFEESFNVKIDLVSPSGTVQVDTNTENIEALDLSRLIDGKKGPEYVYEELDDGRFAITKYMEDIDWYLVVQSTGARDAGQFANVIMLNAALCVVVLVALFVAMRVIARRADALKAESLIDHLTGLPNKRAFERDKEQLGAAPLTADFVFATADLNGLKTVNDTLGHEAGDALIKGAAECLRSCFEPYGQTYRIGGDEFAALLRVPEGKLDGLASALAKTGAAWQGRGIEGLSISCGFAAVSEFPHARIEHLSAISDERMYEDKARYYESSGRERR